jgi:hypothetical protein
MATQATVGASLTMQITEFDIPTNYNGTWPRSALTVDTLQKYDLPLQDFVVHDDPSERLPGTAADDDFGIVGEFGTAAIGLITEDKKSNGSAQAVYGRTTFRLPPEYVAGATLQVVVSAGANTTVADTAMTVDVEARKVNATDGTVGADLVTTAAQTCNNLTAALKTFSLDATGLSAGDLLDIRVSISIHDAAEVTAVKGVILNAYVQANIRG